MGLRAAEGFGGGQAGGAERGVDAGVGWVLAGRVLRPVSSITAAAENAAESAAARARDLDLQVDADLAAAPACGNRLLLERMVGNLVDNAVRHARSRVGLSSTSEGAWAVLTVTDDGPGIPAADRARVFDRFTRLDDARTRSGSASADDGGAGLGLAIVRSIGTAHGASVEARSLPAGGLRILVTLPLADGA